MVSKKLIVGLVAIVVAAGALAGYWAFIKGDGGAPLYPLVMNLGFDEPPPLGTTSNLTFSMSLHPNYLKSYGEFVGHARITLFLPEGFTTADNIMWEEDVTIGGNPISVTWAVTSVKIGSWTIGVDVEIENMVTKENRQYPRFSLLGGSRAVSISVSENSAYIIENEEGTQDTENLVIIVHYAGPAFSPRLPGFVDPTVDNFLDNAPPHEQFMIPLEVMFSPSIDVNLTPLFNHSDNKTPALENVQTLGNTDNCNSLGDDPPGEIKVRGYLYYNDPELGVRPARWFKLEIMDASPWIDDVLETVIVRENGYFESSWLSNSDESGTRDIYLKFIPDSTAARVVHGGWGDYWYVTDPVRYDVPDGYVDFWNVPLGSHGAARIYEYLMDGWDYLANHVGWVPPKVTAVWEYGHDANFGSGCSSWTHYHPEQKYPHEIHVTSGHAGSPDVLLHEYGHHVMYTAWGDWYPTLPEDTDHWIDGYFAPNLVWIEGWADFFAAAVRGNEFTDYLQLGGYTFNLEERGWRLLLT